MSQVGLQPLGVLLRQLLQILVGQEGIQDVGLGGLGSFGRPRGSQLGQGGQGRGQDDAEGSEECCGLHVA